MSIIGNGEPKEAAKSNGIRLLEVSLFQHYQLVDFKIYFDGSMLGHGTTDIP